MSKTQTITVDHIEVKEGDIEKIKRVFGVTDNTEAIQRAVDVAAGKIELEEIFTKHRGTKIKKVYA